MTGYVSKKMLGAARLPDTPSARAYLDKVLDDDDTQVYKKPWVDLTRTQIQDVYFAVLKEHRGGHQMQGQLAFGEALQAAIKEKNNG